MQFCGCNRGGNRACNLEAPPCVKTSWNSRRLSSSFKIFPFLDTAKRFLPTSCHPAGQNPTLLSGIRILWDFQHYHSHYSWNGGHWSLREQKVLVEWSELVKFTELLEILPVVRSKCQSDWLDKPHVFKKKEKRGEKKKTYHGSLEVQMNPGRRILAKFAMH